MVSSTLITGIGSKHQNFSLYAWSGIHDFVFLIKATGTTFLLSTCIYLMMVKAEVDSIASGQAGMFSTIQCKCSSPYTVDQAKESGKIRLRAYVANGIQGTKKDWSEI